MAKRKLDLQGRVFGRLTVISLDEKRIEKEKERKGKGEIKRVNIYWLCRCSCRLQSITSVKTSHLTSGAVSSCGCLCGGGKKNTFEDKEGYSIMWDAKGENFCLISKEDVKAVSQYCWYKGTNGYWRTNPSKKEDGGIYYLHIYITKCICGEYSNLVVDHLDRDPSNNTRENLELKTQADNMKNQSRRSTNTSGKQGVHFEHSLNKWRATIYANGEKISLGCYPLFEEAVETRKKAEKKYGFIGE